jgi:hypothetical protein
MTISLAFLAPDLVRAAVEGRLPRGIGVERLRDAPVELVGKFRLRDVLLDPAQPNALANFNIRFPSRPLIFESAVRLLLAGVDNAQCGFPSHGLGLSLPFAAGIAGIATAVVVVGMLLVV